MTFKGRCASSPLNFFSWLLLTLCHQEVYLTKVKGSFTSFFILFFSAKLTLSCAAQAHFLISVFHAYFHLSEISKK